MYDFYELDDRNMKGTLRDWRKALRTPATYRVGNTVRIQPQFIYLLLLIGGIVLLLCYYNWWTAAQASTEPIYSVRQYNSTYPLTAPFITADLVTFRIGIVADLDHASQSKTNKYVHFSYFKKGFLSYNRVKKYVTVTWDSQPPVALSSTYSHKGRGMELSELIVYDGRLLTFDDRSGVVYEILNSNRVVPWLILPDGDGYADKGFKAEWATMKDEILYIGSIGKEWTTGSGELETHDPMWVKAVNFHGEVRHLNWVNQYKAVRGSIGIVWPGYMIHESGVWSPVKQKWHFLPRKCSVDQYNETKDELMGCNYLITANEDFSNVQALEITKRQLDLGFSSFKFIPGTNDEVIVALKSKEYDGKTSTYITAFTTAGKELLPDTHIENQKYEGIEFI